MHPATKLLVQASSAMEKILDQLSFSEYPNSELREELYSSLDKTKSINYKELFSQKGADPFRFDNVDPNDIGANVNYARLSFKQTFSSVSENPLTIEDKTRLTEAKDSMMRSAKLLHKMTKRIEVDQELSI